MPIEKIKIAIPSHWRNFLEAVDRELSESISLHCIGGFVAEVVYGVPRTTNDLDYLSAETPPDSVALVENIAGIQSALRREYDLYFEAVGITHYPENYEERLRQLDLGHTHLQLLVLEAYDLLLSKLTGNRDKDREDVQSIARSQELQYGVLKERYVEEMRAYLAEPEKHDLTIQLWEEFFDQK